MVSTYSPGASTSRTYRSRSVSVLPGRVSRSRAPSVDPLSGITRGRDDDFRKSINDKVSRLTRALSVKPLSVGASEEFASRGTTGGSSRFLRGKPSVSDLLPDRTSTLEAGLSAGGGADFISRWTAVKFGANAGLQPAAAAAADKALSIDQILLPTTIAVSRKRPLLDDDDVDNVVARGQRISSLLNQLRSIDGPTRLAQNEAGPTRAVNRAEVDSFAALLGKLSFPSLERQGEVRPSRQTLPRGVPLGGTEDFYTRLEHARGDLNRVEGLASKTFNWETQPTRWFSSTLPSNHHKGHADGFVEMKTTESPKELFTFFTDREGGPLNSHSMTAAEQAVRWAQQRRINIESELEHERARERFRLPYSSSEYVVNETPLPTSAHVRDYDDYGVESTTFAPHYVKTIVRPSTGRGASVAPSASSFETERPVLAYGRSISASNLDHPGLGRSRAQQNFKQPISEARQRVRDALCKSRGDPHYFDHRPRDE